MVSLVDGEAIQAAARELAFPRYPGTEGNARAGRLVASWLEEAGLDVEVEPFSYDIVQS